MTDGEVAGFQALYEDPDLGSEEKGYSVTEGISALDKADADSARRFDWTRLILALAIMLVYTLTVAVALAFLGSKIPDPPRGSSPTSLDPYSAAMFDILKVMVLPVVTLMLGFYFGTGSFNRANDRRKS